MVASMPDRPSLGEAKRREIGRLPRMSPEASANFAVFTDAARTRIAVAGGSLIYVIRWTAHEDPPEKPRGGGRQKADERP